MKVAILTANTQVYKEQEEDKGRKGYPQDCGRSRTACDLCKSTSCR